MYNICQDKSIRMEDMVRNEVEEFQKGTQKKK